MTGLKTAREKAQDRLRKARENFHDDVKEVLQNSLVRNKILPCKKCDVDSHENSMSFYARNRR